MVSTRNFTRVSDIMRMCLERIWGQQEGFQEHFMSLASSPSEPPAPPSCYRAAEGATGGAAVLHIPDTSFRGSPNPPRVTPLAD